MDKVVAQLREGQTAVTEGLLPLAMHDHQENPSLLKKELAMEMENAKVNGSDKTICKPLKRLLELAHECLPLV